MFLWINKQTISLIWGYISVTFFVTMFIVFIVYALITDRQSSKKDLHCIILTVDQLGCCIADIVGWLGSFIAALANYSINGKFYYKGTGYTW